MKLLMITRKVDKNDGLAGFTYNWVSKLGAELKEQTIKQNNLKSKAQNSKLYVICLSQGDISGLPENVEIYSLNKENRSGSLLRLIRFELLAFKLIPKVDGIFCHMNPEYTIAVWPGAKIFRKKIVSWYAHKSVTWKTKLLTKMADVILTASSESFRLPSKKLNVVGHGIDVNKFIPAINSQHSDERFKILTIGRISPSKDYESLIKAVKILVDRGLNNIFVQIIGGPGLKTQERYFICLKEMAQKMDLASHIEFLGPIPNNDIIHYLQTADLFINLSKTGSLDKAVLEAMACECLVLTSNVAFTNILGFNFMVLEDNPSSLAEKIQWIINKPKEEKIMIAKNFRLKVVQDHNLDKLVKKIVSFFYL